MKFLSKIKFTKCTWLLIGAFAAGAVIGAVVTWLCVDKKEYTLYISENGKNAGNEDPFVRAIREAENEQSGQNKNNPEKSGAEAK